MTLFEWLSVTGAILITVIGVAGALLRYTVAQQKREYDGAFAELRKKNEKQDDENKKTVERLHEQEKATLKLENAIALADVHKENLASDIGEIKSTMVTKSEFISLRAMLEDAVKAMRRPGEYRTSSSSTLQSPTPGGGGTRR